MRQASSFQAWTWVWSLGRKYGRPCTRPAFRSGMHHHPHTGMPPHKHGALHPASFIYRACTLLFRCWKSFCYFSLTSSHSFGIVVSFITSSLALIVFIIPTSAHSLVRITNISGQTPSRQSCGLCRYLPSGLWRTELWLRLPPFGT